MRRIVAIAICLVASCAGRDVRDSRQPEGPSPQPQPQGPSLQPQPQGPPTTTLTSGPSTPTPTPGPPTKPPTLWPLDQGDYCYGNKDDTSKAKQYYACTRERAINICADNKNRIPLLDSQQQGKLINIKAWGGAATAIIGVIGTVITAALAASQTANTDGSINNRTATIATGAATGAGTIVAALVTALTGNDRKALFSLMKENITKIETEVKTFQDVCTIDKVTDEEMLLACTHKARLLRAACESLAVAVSLTKSGY